MKKTNLAYLMTFLLVPMFIPLLLACLSLISGTILFFVYIMIMASIMIILPASITAVISIIIRNVILKHNIGFPRARWMAYTVCTGAIISYIYGIALDIYEEGWAFSVHNIQNILFLSSAGFICSVIACLILLKEKKAIKR